MRFCGRRGFALFRVPRLRRRLLRLVRFAEQFARQLFDETQWHKFLFPIEKAKCGRPGEAPAHSTGCEESND